MNKKRLHSLQGTLKKNNLDGFLVKDKRNVFYLSGFRGEGLLFVPRGGRPRLITDARFTGEARDTLKGVSITETNGSWQDVLEGLIKKMKVRRLGLESESVNYRDLKKLDLLPAKIKLIPKSDLILRIRSIKDKREIGLIKEAISIIKDTFFYIRQIISPELTEEGLAARIDSFMRLEGAERASFPTIVAGGRRSAYPHATVSKMTLGTKTGAILVDAGCVYRGYHSDLTRTFFLGKISAKFKSLYNTVKQAQEKAIAKIRPGVRIKDIDSAARSHIAKKGLGRFFTHGLGHGIGLDIHELPVISKKEDQRLKPGMVFTVEPGVYIPGRGGVRIEDIALVTDKGCEILTKGIPK